MVTGEIRVETNCSSSDLVEFCLQSAVVSTSDLTVPSMEGLWEKRGVGPAFARR
jgi:hypothetical protein